MAYAFDEAAHAETALTVRMVFNLARRQAEGFRRSLCGQLELDVRIPDHSTLSRRAKKLARMPLAAAQRSSPIHLVIDSAGLRVHSGNRREPPDRRPWRKLPIAVGEKSGQIASADVTATGNHDSMLVAKLLKHSERGLASFNADGAYDSEGVYDAIAEHAGKMGRALPRVLIPLRKRSQAELAELSGRGRQRLTRGGARFVWALRASGHPVELEHGVREVGGPDAARVVLRVLGLLVDARVDSDSFSLLLRKQREIRRHLSARALLDLPPHAAPDHARRALRRLAHKLHPDRFATEVPALCAVAAEVMGALCRAEETLRATLAPYERVG